MGVWMIVWIVLSVLVGAAVIARAAFAWGFSWAIACMWNVIERVEQGTSASKLGAAEQRVFAVLEEGFERWQAALDREVERKLAEQEQALMAEQGQGAAVPHPRTRPRR